MPREAVRRRRATAAVATGGGAQPPLAPSLAPALWTCASPTCCRCYPFRSDRSPTGATAHQMDSERDLVSPGLLAGRHRDGFVRCGSQWRPAALDPVPRGRHGNGGASGGYAADDGAKQGARRDKVGNYVHEGPSSGVAGQQQRTGDDDPRAEQRDQRRAVRQGTRRVRQGTRREDRDRNRHLGPGLHMLRDDTSPEKDRFKAIADKSPAVRP